MTKSEIGRLRALVTRLEAGSRAQRKQNSGKGRGRLLPLKAGKQEIVGARATGKTKLKRGRGQPQKHL